MQHDRALLPRRARDAVSGYYKGRLHDRMSHMALSGAERQKRYRARKRGEDVPDIPRGPIGYKQPPEHIEARKRRGPEHYAWAGDGVSVKGGRKRAERMYPDTKPCELCGSERSERHHRDANTANNSPENIAFLCRACHMREDGRLDAVLRNPYMGSSTSS